MTISPVGALSISVRDKFAKLSAHLSQIHHEDLSRQVDLLYADVADELDAALAAQQAQECVRCGHARTMHGEPCGFHSCGCARFWESHTEIALWTEREMHAAWRKRADEAEAQLAAQQAAITAIRQEMHQALRASDESEKGGGGYWIKGHTYKTVKRWLAALDAL